MPDTVEVRLVATEFCSFGNLYIFECAGCHSTFESYTLGPRDCPWCESVFSEVKGEK